MKNKTRKILFFLLIICSSCSSTYRFSIDIQEPAVVTLPVSAQNVLILNNIVTQPIDFGIERFFDGKPIPEDYPLSLDSAVWTAMKEIAAVFDESNFFNTVAILKEPLREDDEWMSLFYISPEQQNEFYNNGEFNTLFVVKQLLFTVKENVKRYKTSGFSSEETLSVDLRINGTIICSMYTYEEDNPLVTFKTSDSLFLRSIHSYDSIGVFKAIPEFGINELSLELGNKAAKCFTPTWNTAERILFNSFNPRMQEAVGYASNHKWATAESIWLNEYEKNTKPANKAKTAYNISVANEMQDNLESALEWAQKARGYFKSDNKENNQEIEIIDNYISELVRRIGNNKLLDLQWGKE